MAYSSALNNGTLMQEFRTDMTTTLATILGIDTSQVHVTGVQLGAVVVLDALATASNSSALPALDSALDHVLANPMAALGTGLTSKYGITGNALVVHFPPSPPSPGPPSPPPPPSPSPPSPLPPPPPPPPLGKDIVAAAVTPLIIIILM